MAQPIKKKFLTLLVLLASFLPLLAYRQPAAIAIRVLRTEGRTEPIGIDIVTPRLSWELEGRQRGLEQTAYQVLVASSPEKLAAGQGDVWNSGKIASAQSQLVRWRGAPLKSRTHCYWKVKVWTREGESDWSPPAHFSTGLYKGDWKARWIGLDRAFPWDSVSMFARLSARYFRKDFTASGPVKKATVYISGLGLYELYINGQKIGRQVLAPSPTDYSQSIKYNTFDVTANVQGGVNAIATVLGNGRFFAMRQRYKPQKWHTFGFPKMLLQLEIEYANGKKQVVQSDGSWKVTADGPIRTNNEYDGEEYDATREMAGWNRARFNDRTWLKAEPVKAPGGALVAQLNENMEVMETIRPKSVKEGKPGVFIMDMGQNMAGWVKMKVKGKRGDTVVLRYAESLTPTGELYVENLRDAKVTDGYVLKGEGEEEWHPRFVFHGFRYVEISGYPGKPHTDDFVGEVVYDRMETTGSFETSNKTINQIHRNAYWGIRSNYKGMPVDCPQRNERQPWLGDRATGAYGESFLFDNALLYAKWLDDIEQSQTPEGSIPDVAPSFWYYYKDNVTWPGTYLMIADMLYRQYGDKQPVVKHYASMKKWMQYMRTKYSSNNIVTKDSYGDWCVPPESPELIKSQDSTRTTDPALLATATYYYLLGVMQRFARLTNNRKDEQAFAALAVQIRQAFNKRFYDPGKKRYANNTVTANILPLAFNMVPETAGKDVFRNIVDKIMVENGGHISTGVIGTQWLMRWLTIYGRPDIAYRLATVRDYPGWGYMVENGATTIWELWNGNTASPKMNSQNHVMLLGDLLVWMYENLGGIKSAADGPGFKRIQIKPSFVEGLDWVKASYRSGYGVIRSEWHKDGSKLRWKISIPGNTKATVSIPATSAEQVKESGKAATSADCVSFTGMEDGRAVFEVGAGEYEFEVEG
ncbi:MAG: glycoside hydrolase family 78 protein [Williamsia sp.]|nr:glycoside hydrolase family 78 protein [Williamsia sp.]